MDSERKAVTEAIVGEVGVPIEGLSALLRTCVPVERARGQYLVKVGCPAPDVYFIHRGMTQLYHVDASGRIYTKAFHREGEFTGAHAAAATGSLATFSVRALEDLRVTSVPFAALDALAARQPALQLYLRRTAERLFWLKEQREMSLLTLSATERYQQVLRSSPWLMERVRQKDLASYLGITEVSLSRLRGRRSAP